MRQYKAASSLIGALTTFRFLLLFKPDHMVLDFDKKEICVQGNNSSRFSLNKIIDVELDFHPYCADLVVETQSGNYTIKSISLRMAQKLKSLIRSYIWKRNIRVETTGI